MSVASTVLSSIPTWKKVLAVILLPFIIFAGLLWTFFGWIFTMNSIVLFLLGYSLHLIFYLLIQIDHTSTLFFDWPIVLLFVCFELVTPKNSFVIKGGFWGMALVYCSLRYGLSLQELGNAWTEPLLVVSLLLPTFLLINSERIWRPVAEDTLHSFEKALYDAHIKNKFTMEKVAGLGTVHVPFSGNNDEEAIIEDIVLIHGFAAGNAFWAMNLGPLSKKYNVYAVEWLGCGRSDRPRFKAKTFEDADVLMIDSLEAWRKEKNLDTFILGGHSMGAMLVTSYATKFPQRVKHLMLISPAGVNHPPATNPGLILRLVAFLWNQNVTPLSIVRWVGPYGPTLLRFIVTKRIEWMPETSAMRTGDINVEHIVGYTYQNWGAYPSGEMLLHTHMLPGAHARKPLCDALTPGTLRVPVTFMYGGGPDWMNSDHGFEVVKKLENEQYAHWCKVPLAGHQVFLDNPGEFNTLFTECVERYNEKHLKQVNYGTMSN